VIGYLEIATLFLNQAHFTYLLSRPLATRFHQPKCHLSPVKRSNRDFNSICKYLSIIIILSGFTFCSKQSEKKTVPPNILFIAVDDLNDWIGVLGGHPQAHTPNIDKLARRSVLFTNAHTTAPACNPSRVAIMTGLYPVTSGIYLNAQPWRPVLGQVVTLPQYFREKGYQALRAGKIYHGAYPDSASWDEAFPSKTKVKPNDPSPSLLPVNGIPDTKHFDWGKLEVNDDQMGDTQVANWIIDKLNARYETPFFLAAGIFRPHLPWYVPEKYFDRYPLKSIQLPAYIEKDLEDIPAAGIAMARPDHDHKNVVDYDQWEKAVQGYLASIEFADVQVGRIIDALDQSEYKDNTIVVLWSDHGWHLGEKDHWRKFSLWERSTRVTFMIMAPGLTNTGKVSKPVSLIDIYPTLVDLAGLPEKQNIDGISLRPLLESEDAAWNRPSLTTHGRGNHSIRDDRWRYIRYADGSEELYDHNDDPNEWHNLAEDPGYADEISRLSNWLPESEAISAPLRDSY